MEQIKFADIWNTLSKIDCREHVETKKVGYGQDLKYLSWSWAWSELMKRYPEAEYTVREWEGRPYMVDEAGVLVMTEVTIGSNARRMWLAVMDGANNAMKREAYTYQVKGSGDKPYDKRVGAVDMCAINKAIMRCLVKNLAMFGLGLNLYAGEDLPVGVEAADAGAGAVDYGVCPCGKITGKAWRDIDTATLKKVKASGAKAITPGHVKAIDEEIAARGE